MASGSSMKVTNFIGLQPMAKLALASPPFAVANFATEGELSTVDYDSSDDGFWVIYQEKASISELNDMGFCLPLQAELVELYW